MGFKSSIRLSRPLYFGKKLDRRENRKPGVALTGFFRLLFLRSHLGPKKS